MNLSAVIKESSRASTTRKHKPLYYLFMLF